METKLTKPFYVLIQVTGTKSISDETKGIFLFQTDNLEELRNYMEDISELNDDECQTRTLATNVSW